MKNYFTKLVYLITTITLFSCNNNNTRNKTLDTIQGKWYSQKLKTIIIEVNNDKWIEGDEQAGYTTFDINPINDTLFEITVKEQKNIYTNYKVGMKQSIKILELGEKYIHYAYISPSKTEFCELVVKDSTDKPLLRRRCKYHPIANIVAFKY